MFHAIQTTWIAAGASLLVLTVVAAVVFDKSLTQLASSDDSYVASFAGSIPVLVFFAIGSGAGWWFRSARIEWIATMGPLGLFASLLWIADLVHDFGEGDQIFGYLGLAILIGGLAGSIAFWLRGFYTRCVLSFAPHLVVGAGYLTALEAMSI